MLSEIMNEVQSPRSVFCSVFSDLGSKWPMIHWEFWIPALPAEALSSADEPGDAEMY